MIKIYTAPTTFEAHLIRSILEAQDVEAVVTNEEFSAYGTLGLPEVWVHEKDLEVVQEVLKKLQESDKKDGALSITDPDEAGSLSLKKSAWVCEQCQEENPANFETCWKCSDST